MKRAALLGVAIALVGASCAPDPLDTYSTPGEVVSPPSATRAPLASTTTTEPASGAVGEAALPEPEPTFAANGETVDVRSLDNSFILQDLEIEAGTEVNWINGGRNDHNILPVDESLTWGIDRDTFVPGTAYAHVFDTPGVFPYYCSIHGTADVGMIGAIIVTEPT